MDRITPETRSRIMKRVRGKDTQPEWVVRRVLHAAGYRYRLHAADLPGKPDIVMRNRRKAVFIHGCFWHHHPDPACRKATIPATRTEFWQAKIRRNVERDAQAEAALRTMGYDVLTLWECHLKDKDVLEETLRRFLGPPSVAKVSPVEGEPNLLHE